MDGFINTTRRCLTSDPHTSMIQILDAKIVPEANDNEFGPIRSGKLKIQCRQLKRTKVTRTWTGPRKLSFSFKGTIWIVRWTKSRLGSWEEWSEIYLLLVRMTSSASRSQLPKKEYKYDTFDGWLIVPTGKTPGRRISTFSLSGYWGSGLIGKVWGLSGLRFLKDFLVIPGVEDPRCYDCIAGSLATDDAGYIITLI
jgi:hypothetical protein